MVVRSAGALLFSLSHNIDIRAEQSGGGIKGELKLNINNNNNKNKKITIMNTHERTHTHTHRRATQQRERELSDFDLTNKLQRRETVCLKLSYFIFGRLRYIILLMINSVLFSICM